MLLEVAKEAVQVYMKLPETRTFRGLGVLHLPHLDKKNRSPALASSTETVCATTVECKAKWRIGCSRLKVDRRGAPSPHTAPPRFLFRVVAAINNDNTTLPYELCVHCPV